MMRQPGKRFAKVQQILSTSASRSAKSYSLAFSLVVHPLPGLLEFIARLVLTVDDLAVFHIGIGDDLRVADPIALLVLKDGNTLWR